MHFSTAFLHYVGGHSGRVVTLSPPTSEAGIRKAGSCLPLVGSLQYSVESDVKPQINK